MGFPERADTWHAGAKPAQAAFAEVARAIARFEQVTVCASPAVWSAAVALFEGADPQIRVVEMEMNDSWLRDTVSGAGGGAAVVLGAAVVTVGAVAVAVAAAVAAVTAVAAVWRRCGRWCLAVVAVVVVTVLAVTAMAWREHSW
jgi:hypothetical protein